MVSWSFICHWSSYFPPQALFLPGVSVVTMKATHLTLHTARGSTFKPEPSFSTQPHIIPQHLPAGFTPLRTLPMSSRHLWHDRYPICQLNINSFSSNVAKWSHIPLSAFRALLQWLFPSCLSILCQLHELVCAYQIQGKCLSFRVTCALLQVSLTFCLLTPAFRRISSNQNPCSFFHIFLSPRQFM